MAYTADKDYFTDDQSQKLVPADAKGAQLLVRAGQVMSDAQAGFFGILPAEDAPADNEAATDKPADKPKGKSE